MRDKKTVPYSAPFFERIPARRDLYKEVPAGCPNPMLEKNQQLTTHYPGLILKPGEYGRLVLFT